MFQTEINYFVVLALIALSTPFLPSKLLFLLDTLLVKLGMVVLLLYLIRVGPTVGIFGLMAIALLFLERNRRKVGHALEKLDAMDVHRPPQATVQEASLPQKTVPVRAFDQPSPVESTFVPDGDDDSNFEPVAPTINQKAVLSSIYPLSSASSTASQFLYEKLGVGHLDGVETFE